MFTYHITLNRHSDFSQEIEIFLKNLKKSEIPQSHQAILAQQIEETIHIYRNQIQLNNTKSYATHQIFTGDGYRITINIRENLITKIKHLLYKIRK